MQVTNDFSAVCCPSSIVEVIRLPLQTNVANSVVMVTEQNNLALLKFVALISKL
jgi:hypothetical protein